VCLLAVMLGACRSRDRGASAPKAAASPSPASSPSPTPPSLGLAEGQGPPAPLTGPAFFPPLERVPRLKPGVVLPAAVEAVEHAKTYWAVYLVVAVSGGRPSVPGFDEAVRRVRDSGVPIGAYGGFCDQGGREALADVGEVDTAVALYFQTEGEARQFAGDLDPPPVRVARVTTYCAD
jgi:hypothetical protein